MKLSIAHVVAEARRLLADCQALKESLWSTLDDPVLGHGRVDWIQWVCARVGKEEVRLIRLLAKLGEKEFTVVPYSGSPREIEGVRTPELLRAARTAVREVLRVTHGSQRE